MVKIKNWEWDDDNPNSNPNGSQEPLSADSDNSPEGNSNNEGTPSKQGSGKRSLEEAQKTILQASTKFYNQVANEGAKKIKLLFSENKRGKELIDEEKGLVEGVLPGKPERKIRFDSMIQRLGTESLKTVSRFKNSISKYYMPDLLNRVITKAPLSKCKRFLEREKVVFLLDVSPSTEPGADMISTIANSSYERGDCEVVFSSNISMVYDGTELFDNSKEHLIKMLLKKYISKKEFKRRIKLYTPYPDELLETIKKGESAQFFFNHKRTTVSLPKFLKGKTVIIFSDSDCYLNPNLEAIVNKSFAKRIILLDGYYYYRGINSPSLEKMPFTQLARTSPKYTTDVQENIHGRFNNFQRQFNYIYELCEKHTNAQKLIIGERIPFYHKFSDIIEWYAIHDKVQLYQAFKHIK